MCVVLFVGERGVLLPLGEGGGRQMGPNVGCSFCEVMLTANKGGTRQVTCATSSMSVPRKFKKCVVDV